jgi:membrane protein implicated in regulation of membrane protease activity
VTASVLAAAVLAASPGPAVHLAALGLVVVIALAVYGVVRWRRRREAAQAESEPNGHDTSSPSRSSQTRRP